MKQLLGLILALSMAMTIFPLSVTKQSFASEGMIESAEWPQEDDQDEALIIIGSEDLPVEIISDPDGVNDNDELFEQYIESLFYRDDASTFELKKAKRVLTGTNAVICSILKTYIKQVAAGELSSTVFDIPLSELGLEQTYWTAKELGVDAIVVDDTISDEAIEAAVATIDYDLNRIISVLLSDCPYEMYWYDKVSGASMSGPGISASYNGEWTLSLVGSLEFSFSVAEGYAAGVYTVNAEGVSSAQKAAANAKAIVDKYAAYSDYEKLLAYKNEICDVVSYNYEAASGGISFGNPWQLVWVFDNDIDTNVVCEGYAKAFKYLCDMSIFESNLISCILVTGIMSGGTGAGAHMWNIVTMDDGLNYLVDVTNCDEGTVGAPDELFLTEYASGSITDGYVFDCNGISMLYLYDTAQFELYNESDLTISQNEYIPGQAGNNIAKGDVNGDGDVNANDLTVLARHLARIEMITDESLLKAADVTGEGSADAGDLTKLARYLAKIITSLE